VPSIKTKILIDLQSKMDFHVRSTALIFYPQTQTDKEIKRYEATKFLESLKNPVFKEKTRTVEDYKITVILFIESKKRTEIPKYFSNDTSKFMKKFAEFFKAKNGFGCNRYYWNVNHANRHGWQGSLPSGNNYDDIYIPQRSSSLTAAATYWIPATYM